MPDKRPRGAPTGSDAAMHDLVVADAVRRAAARYFAARRARVQDFVRRNFGLRGTLALHRRALGWDLVRAPVNLALAPAHVALKLAAPALEQLGARRAGRFLRHHGLLLETAVAREVAWRVQTELLELPCVQRGRSFDRDALLEEIIADPAIHAWLHAPLAAIGRHAGEADFRRRLETAMLAYAGTRPAAAEIATGLISAGVGAVALKQLTPGAISLGPLLAAVVAQQAAIAAFPLGATLGGLWYGWFPAAAAPALVGGVTAGLMGAAALAASFAGIVTDPLQRTLGLHQRRLRRLIDALESDFADPESRGFVGRDHYAARLLDLVDLIAGAARLATR